MATHAQSLFTQYQSLDGKQKLAFRALMHEENLTHDEVFGHLKGKEFSSQESSDYLGVSIPTLRRYIKRGLLEASTIVGRSHLYKLDDLRELKRSLRKK